MLVGFCNKTGKAIKGWPRCLQSIKTIVDTQTGSYIGMRPFGSYVGDLVDQPMTPYWVSMAMASMAAAITRFEPEFLIDEFKILEADQNGKINIAIHGLYKPVDSDVAEEKTAEVAI